MPVLGYPYWWNLMSGVWLEYHVPLDKQGNEHGVMHVFLDKPGKDNVIRMTKVLVSSVLLNGEMVYQLIKTSNFDSRITQDFLSSWIEVKRILKSIADERGILTK